MARTTRKSLSSLPTNNRPPKITHVEEEKFMGIMKQIGEQSLSNMTGEHITEVINQRGKIADYIHEENMQEHERFKMLQTNTLVQLVVLLVFVDKSYLPQALTLIFGFIGGFGLGRTFKESTSKKE